MSKVCVITGGGGGMGFEVAQLLGRDRKIVLAGRTPSKLDRALAELKKQGVDVEAFPCDVSDRESTKKLVKYAAGLGDIETVVHTAGVSPHMGTPAEIFTINARGTINVDEEFGSEMNGGCILNVASMAAYMLPASMNSMQEYKMCFTDIDALQATIVEMVASAPEEQRTGMAYSLSKRFVIWFTGQMAIKLGAQGTRVVSISPGTFMTSMTKLEGADAISFAERCPLGRAGEPVEIARMMAFMVSDECSYLDGVDILYDGGAVVAYQTMMEARQQ